MIRLLLASVVVAAAVAAGLAAERPAHGQDDRAAVVGGDTQFALDLYAKVRGHDGNLFFSPYSISTALAMTRAGARGDTAAEMDRVMHFTLPQERLNPAFAGLIKEVNGDSADKDRGYELSTANALWGQKNYGFKPDFLKALKDGYGAGLNEVDFHADAEAARLAINAWVGKETHDKIKDLLHEGDLTADTRLVLTNAIYFKGNWAVPFKKDRTKNEPFLLAAGRKADAPMMHQTADFGYFDGGTFQALDLHYAGDDLSMVVLLPKKVDGLADLEKSLTADKLADWLGKLEYRKVIVSLPKFKTEQRVSLTPVLSDLGMKLAFNDRKADLSGMGGKPGDLGISDVVHQAYIDANEEGTEAAGSTGVFVGEATAVRPDQPTPVFRADHPFVFLIRHTGNDSILFLGRLAEPSK
jgi:serine protease inhibitor